MNAADRSRGTILLVDDEKDILVALEDLFEDSYTVLASTSPVRALEMLRERPEVSVIVSDQRMPEMPGHLFIARAHEISDAEAILLTGYADMDAVISAINDGRVAGYVHKPWEGEALRSMVALAEQRHRLSRALDGERALFAGLLDNATDAIVLTDADGRILRINAAKAAVIGRAREACVGERLADLQGEADEHAEGGLERRGDRWLRVQRTAITPPDGRPVLLAIETDVSAERELERRLRQSEKLQALGTLAGGIAHDFNNLLTAVIGNLDLATRRPGHPSVPRYIAGALGAAQRGASLTQRLLSFTRQRDMGARALDLNALVAGMADLIGRTIGGVVTVELALDPATGKVRGDPDQLELALLNLCVNARDAMPEGGRLRIRTHPFTQDELAPDGLKPGHYACLAVEDEGTGMAPQVLARVFEPFFTTKEVGKGTGLGLSMAYSMASGLGGIARVESTAGQGTTVTLLLPQAAGDEEDHAPPASAGEPGAPLRVLLVEDDPAVREVTRGYLEELGHRALIAQNADEARAIVAEGEPLDLLITDFAMPGETGLELVAALRIVRPELPALLVTGFVDAAAIPGDIGKLAKPFSAAELAAAIAALGTKV